ncbi:hypothetical protein [Candidatus Sororendozoicomonas aggregata]|uniref:hypothetical protein n=1 Tax=Candidatus Sororendozoicomonas aggregata TaxID=3073239 RepID=UPI002ED0D732
MNLRCSDGGDDNQAGDSVMIKPFVVVAISSVLCPLVSASATASIRVTDGHNKSGYYVQFNHEAQMAASIFPTRENAKMKKAICSDRVYGKYLCSQADSIIYTVANALDQGRFPLGCTSGFYDKQMEDMRVFPATSKWVCGPF